MLELEPPDEPPPEEPPELPPLGMLELLPPELPEEPEDPDEPEELEDEPPEDGLGMLEGMLDEEEDCCCAHPPMRKAETEPTSAVCTAMESSRRTVGLWDIALSPLRPIAGRSLTKSSVSLSLRVARGVPRICDREAERALTWAQPMLGPQLIPKFNSRLSRTVAHHR